MPMLQPSASNIFSILFFTLALLRIRSSLTLKLKQAFGFVCAVAASFIFG